MVGQPADQVLVKYRQRARAISAQELRKAGDLVAPLTL